MDAGKTKDKKFSVKGKDAGYDPAMPKNIAKAKALSVAQGKAASDEAYDPLDPENIAEEKELAKARGAAASDKKMKDKQEPVQTYKGVDIIYDDIQGNYWAVYNGQVLSIKDIDINRLKRKIDEYLGTTGDSKTKDSLFKGQKVTAIKSEQGLREGETYTVLGEEEIIKQIVGEDNTTVYKLQDSSGNIIVIEDCDGLFYEVKDAKTKDVTYPEDFVQYGWKLQQNGRQLIATHPEHNLEYRGTPYEIVPKLQRWLTDYNISKMGNKDEEPNEDRKSVV